MYKFSHPAPILINLCDQEGFELRQKAAEYIVNNQNRTGAERGSVEEQGFGALAEIVIRSKLGMPLINPEDHPLAYDILLPSGVKVDVKCRGGALPFQEEYLSGDDVPREAKHNFFARQIYDNKLDTDIYLLTHLETPSDRSLPGSIKQRKWKLYVCGWVSKERVAKEGVYLPRGSLTEQGNTWFTYRGQEIEFYNRNLNGLKEIASLLTIDRDDVEQDKTKVSDLNLTSVDAVRIGYDLVGRGILAPKHVEFIRSSLKLNKTVKPILSPNQYLHLLKWLKKHGQATSGQIEKAKQILPEEPYQGI